jgi:antitoxin VapB
MAFHIRDPETDALVRALAQKRKIGLTEAVRLAVDAELKRETYATPVADRINAIRREVREWPRTGLKADKAFFDELSDDD